MIAFGRVGGAGVGLEFGKTAQVFAVVLVLVVLGMLARRASAAFADRADRPVRILSVIVLVAVIAGALLAERDNLAGYLAEVGVVAAVFCLCSPTIGYAVPRLVRVDHWQAIASAFEVGVHNSTLAITAGSSQAATTTSTSRCGCTCSALNPLDRTAPSRRWGWVPMLPGCLCRGSGKRRRPAVLVGPP